MKTAVQITLPSDLKQWIDQQVAQGDFKTPSAFFESLARAERKRVLRQHIDKKLIASLDSGPSTPMTQNDWDRIRTEGRKRVARRRKHAT